VVYVGTATANRSSSGIKKGAVDALRASDGTLLWHNQTNFAALVLTVADGIVYVGALFDSPLDALRASDGSLLWQYKGDRQVNQATMMDGVVFLTYESAGYKDTGSTVDALRISDGSHLWRYTIDPQDEALQVAVGDGMVYVYVGTLHGIVALDANRGNKRWFHAANNVFALAVGP
jgi:outer membrane protein assembly factor BamB